MYTYLHRVDEMEIHLYSMFYYLLHVTFPLGRGNFVFMGNYRFKDGATLSSSVIIALRIFVHPNVVFSNSIFIQFLYISNKIIYTSSVMLIDAVQD